MFTDSRTFMILQNSITHFTYSYHSSPVKNGKKPIKSCKTRQKWGCKLNMLSSSIRHDHPMGNPDSNTYLISVHNPVQEYNPSMIVSRYILLDPLLISIPSSMLMYVLKVFLCTGFTIDWVYIVLICAHSTWQYFHPSVCSALSW